ncbi:NUDIX hydrolase domain-like protein [Clohesyomyces aquaticus]|uniref:NUDIX hydrolase domain-like protein n=1 Tax=Clohesyomyces aquaticus TaxID=1231657 RepID=A0A1Y1ZHT6_9PLEO|nr:NUDIX hydrolase domain-like protein [Clohesyomyces aquaticus]
MSQEHPIPVKVIGEKDTAIVYAERAAVRAILYNRATNQIALIHVNKGNYFKLPGGGVEADEDHQLAIAREILEETGCTISLEDKGAYFAKSEEWRNDLHQISYCYIAALDKDTGQPELTHLEKAEGLTHQWTGLDDALRAMREVEPTSELGKFIKERDTFFVEMFASKINQAGK